MSAALPPASTPIAEGPLVFNGINGATGEYLLPPQPASVIGAVVRGQRLDPQQLSELKFVHTRANVTELGAIAGVNLKRLDQTGWGVIFADDSPPQLREALRELLDLRKQQAARTDERLYREFSGAAGYRPGESKLEFLARHGAGPGPADPAKVPYYLLIVGDPESIPFRFQYQLDVQYAAGRLWFDKLEDYAHYAQSVVAAETGQVSLPRKAVFFGVANEGDRATQLSARDLVAPLADELAARVTPADGPWEIRKLLKEQATKQRLAGVLGGAETPALLFTASHGMGFPLGDSRQRPHQGALLCQDWPGPLAAHGPISSDVYFAADDVAGDAGLLGLIAFHFACYGAGTPRLDDFSQLAFQDPKPIAERAFVSALPQRLLGHAKGGALAVIGHVERAWGYSFHWEKAGRQLGAFQSTLQELMEGAPVGAALEYFNTRYAELASDLADELQEIRFGKTADDFALAGMWTAGNDARNYVIFGDPAVRLPVKAGEQPPRPRLEPVTLHVPADDTSPPRERGETSPKRQRGAITAGPASSGTPDDQTSPTRARGAGAITITLPLKITVELGDATASAAIVTARPASSGTPTGPASRGIQRSEGTQPDFFGVEIDPDYGSRAGYDPEFLGAGSLRVSLPKMTAAMREQAAVLLPEYRLPGDSRHELKYHHFSVVMNARRRLAWFTAVNIHGRQAKELGRETDAWILDPRIAAEEQVGAELYFDNPFDKGHLVRRLDPVWGRTARIAKRANDDTYHYTNCAPQHSKFNRGKKVWQGVENYLLARATDAEQKLTVFSGPVFRADDPLHRGVRIPRDYWKVCVLVDDEGQLASLAFLLSQEPWFDSVDFGAVDVARTFQTSVAEIESLTKLSFGRLRAADVGTVDSFAIEALGGALPPRHELDSLDEIRLPIPSPPAPPAAPPAAEGGAAAPGVSFETPAFGTPGRALEAVPGADVGYYLLAYDENCRERTDHPAGKISEIILDAVSREPVTDLFLFSHGWMGDVLAAREQYVGWIQAMLGCAADRQRARELRPGFRPLLVGVHWPSLPWGDERFGAMAFAAAAAATDAVSQIVEDFAPRLGDTPEIRRAIETIAAASQSGAEPAHLPPEVAIAYSRLAAIVRPESGGVAAPPGLDGEPFDAEAVYQEAIETRSVSEGISTRSVSEGPESAISFGLFDGSALLAPLRTLSFWKMKDRARQIGETAVHPFLASLEDAIGDRDIRIHLAGHSFGCIVASAAIAGPPAAARPIVVDSLSLIQGALSLWGYCQAIPFAQRPPGYFHRLIAQRRVKGPIVTTRSKHDSAVGTWYPRAAGVAGQVVFVAPTLPKYGAIGTFGIQGSDLPLTDLPMLPADAAYSLAGGEIYNVEGSGVINTGGGFSGAHSDIRKPEVAHLVWSAVLTAMRH